MPRYTKIIMIVILIIILISVGVNTALWLRHKHSVKRQRLYTEVHTAVVDYWFNTYRIPTSTVIIHGIRYDRETRREFLRRSLWFVGEIVSGGGEQVYPGDELTYDKATKTWTARLVVHMSSVDRYPDPFLITSLEQGKVYEYQLRRAADGTMEVIQPCQVHQEEK